MRQIFANANSFIKKSTTLSILVTEIDRLDWYSAREEEAFGELYEGLLEKNANEKKSGAGQYFTPRPLIDSMVAVMKPTLEDVIQHPAAGTGDSSFQPAATFVRTVTQTPGPTRSKPSITRTRFTAWSLCRIPTAWR